MISPKPHADTAPMQSTWLITFADLITLLLCAFLLFFSVTWGRKGGGAQPSPLAAVNVKDGTVLAKDTKGREAAPVAKQGITLLLREADYESDGMAVREESWNHLRNKVISEGYVVTSLDLSTCSPLEPSRAWEVAEQRAMQLVRQLIDAGVRRDVFRLQIAGPFCDSVRSDDDSKTVTALHAELELKNG